MSTKVQMELGMEFGKCLHKPAPRPESIHPFSEVWVANGTYKPETFRSDVFLFTPNVSVYGGFNGTETQRDQKNCQ